MAFYTRFFLYRFIRTLNTNPRYKDLPFESKDTKKESKEKMLGVFPLYTRESNSKGYEFKFLSLDEFSIPSPSFSLLNNDSHNELIKVFEHLVKTFKGTLKQAVPEYLKNFSFIPVLREKDGILEKDEEGNFVVVQSNMKHQALFYAICLYLVESANPTQESFQRWMRVCSNFIENTNSNSDRKTHLKVLNRITDLGTRSFSLINSEDVEIFARGCDYIYECLQGCKYQQSIELESALWEEREKAIKILSGGQEIEIIIKEAGIFISIHLWKATLILKIVSPFPLFLLCGWVRFCPYLI